MFQILGYLVFVLFGAYLTLGSYFMCFHGGEEFSSPFSKYGRREERFVAIIVLLITCVVWYFIITLCPFTIIAK